MIEEIKNPSIYALLLCKNQFFLVWNANGQWTLAGWEFKEEEVDVHPLEQVLSQQLWVPRSSIHTYKKLSEDMEFWLVYKASFTPPIMKFDVEFALFPLRSLEILNENLTPFTRQVIMEYLWLS